MSHIPLRRTGAALLASATLLAGSATVGATTSSAQAADDHYTTKTPNAVGYGERSAPWTPRRRRSASRCSRRAATPSTRRSPRPPRSASPSRTPPVSAAAGSSSTTTPRPARCSTIDGRETAPAAMPPTPSSTRRRASPSLPAERSPAASVRRRPRHPGDLGDGARPVGHASGWARLLAPADPARPTRLRRSTTTFRQQTRTNQTRFAAFTATPKLFLPGGDAAGGRLGLHATPTSPTPTEMLGREGIGRVLPRRSGRRDRPRLVQHPPTTPDAPRCRDAPAT